MKRILSVVLCSIILLSAVVFTSCTSEPKPKIVESINGQSHEVVYAAAMEVIKEESTRRYTVDIDVAAKVKVAFISIPITADGVYTYSYVGPNSHHILTEEGEKFISNDLLSGFIGSYLGNLDKETYYVDGVYYCEDLDGVKTKEEKDGAVKDSPVESAVDSVVEEYMSTAVCYECDGETYFEVLLEGDNLKMGAFKKEMYRVYFDDNGLITKTVIKGESDLYAMDVTMNYRYEADDINAPSDADSYKTVS